MVCSTHAVTLKFIVAVGKREANPVQSTYRESRREQRVRVDGKGAGERRRSACGEFCG